MNRAEFIECVAMLRSTDAMTYEEGYHWLQGYLVEYIDDLIALMLNEKEPRMRSKFVEVVGDSQLKKVIPYMVTELEHEHREVRSWAYNSLVYFEDAEAEAIAKEYARCQPNEDFLH